MEDILLFYNISDVNIKDSIFYYKNKRLILYELKEKEDINYNLIRYPFHIPILNIYNSYITFYNNKRYVLLSCFNSNRIITNKDINYLIYNNFRYYINYYEVWKKKLNNIRNYYDNKDNYLYEYFYSLALNIIQVSKNIDYYQLSYGYCLKRFQDFIDTDSFYNLCKYRIGGVVTNISLYIKYFFFYLKNNNLDLDIKSNLSSSDYYFLICRLLFPNYYFDYNLDDIYNLFINYTEYIKELLIKIKKRQSVDLSIFNYLINLL